MLNFLIIPKWFRKLKKIKLIVLLNNKADEVFNELHYFFVQVQFHKVFFKISPTVRLIWIVYTCPVNKRDPKNLCELKDGRTGFLCLLSLIILLFISLSHYLQYLTINIKHEDLLFG